MAVRVSDWDKGWKAFKRLVADAQGREVVVGIVAGEIATYATVNELGSRDGKIPARPFLSSTIDTNREKYAADINRQIQRAIHERAGTVEGALTRVGMRVRNDVIKAIKGWQDPPNAASTIARKGVNNPLVDTGALQRAITVEVRRRQNDGGAP